MSADRMTWREAARLAIAYARQGVPAGPVAIGWDETKGGTNKRPLTRHGHNEFSTDQETVARQFKAAERRCRDDEVMGVGLRPGPAGLVVVDVDVAGGKVGAETLAKLETEHGALPEHPVTATASGGRHEWFRKTGHVSNRGLGQDVDVRGDAGWVVAPGTVTPWGNWGDPHRVANLSPAPMWPGWMAARQGAAGERPESAPGGRWTELDRDALHPGERAALEALEALGGHSAIRASDGTIQLTRPGKDHGVSAQIGFGRPDQVEVFSSAWSGLKVGTYSAEELAQIVETGAMLEGGTGGTSEAEDESPWLDLTAYLSGDYEPLQPTVGARRSDGRALLYRGKCHFLVGETGIGKSWFGCHHVAAELLAGATVVYAHFEEPNPHATVARLGRLGVPAEVIASGLRWLDVDKARKYREGLKGLDQPPALVVLDGVVAACGGRSINDDDTVNWFREKFVNPATRLGAAVLALHHPVKDVGRRGERGGRGSGSWINLVDGVHFQALPGQTWIGRGRKGWIDLYADKDREGSVMDGASEHPKNAGWRLLGRLEVEDVDGKVSATLTAPLGAPEGQEPETDEVRELAEHIVNVLQLHGGGYPSQGELTNWLRAQGVRVRNGDLGPALQWLEDQGRLSRPPFEERKARPGQLLPKIAGAGP